VESARRNKQISEIVGEALEEYLDKTGQVAAGLSVVAESWGALRLPKDRVRQILEEEEGLLEA
jgi:uncharacterized membrane protein